MEECLYTRWYTGAAAQATSATPLPMWGLEGSSMVWYLFHVTPSDTWFAIFRILFPEAPLPESPYADSVSADAIRAFMDHFHRRAQAILSALIREQLGNTLVLHSDQQRILDTALESAIAGLVWRIGPSGQEADQQQTAPNSTETGMQAAFEGDMDVPLANDELADPQMPQTPDLPLTDIANWTSSWGFEGFQDFWRYRKYFSLNIKLGDFGLLQVLPICDYYYGFEGVS
jgi:hypothetical protein